MKKLILVIVGLTISLNTLAQTKIWITKPKSNDTIGYIDQKYRQFIVTRQITQLEFDRLLIRYEGAYTIVTSKGQIIDPYQPQSTNRFQSVTSSSTTQRIDTNSRGSYLIKAGEYKNAAIAVSLGTGVIVGAILSYPPESETMNGYSNITMTAGVVGAIGGIISFGLNIAGNNMLIKAGLSK